METMTMTHVHLTKDEVSKNSKYLKEIFKDIN